MTTQTQPQSGFSLKSFAPSWGAAVMGTAALSVALMVLGLTVPARVMLAIAVVFAVFVLGATAARWLRHRTEATADLRHPIKGGMTATAAGALLTLSVAVGKVVPGYPLVVAVLLVLGAVLALIIGWEFLAEMFTSQDATLAQVSGAWFVPPVVAIIVPLAMLPLLTVDNASSLLPLAWAFLGMGAILYLVVTATLFVRSISHPLPPAALAPTLFIGMGPAGLLGLDMVRLAQVSVDLGVADESLMTAVLPLATMAWGFGVWWMVAALVVLKRGYGRLPFALSWWGFTFPLAAWTIATLVLGEAWNSGLLHGVGVLATVALSALWVYVAIRTLMGIRAGTIWQH